MKLINPEKFIQQNNFIPVPSIMMNTKGSNFKQIFSNFNANQNGAAQNFFESGETITRERFAKSRE